MQARIFCQLLQQPLPALFHLLGVASEDVPCRRQDDLAVVALEQRFAQFVFDALDGPGQGRRAEVAGPAGATEVERMGQVIENFDGADIHKQAGKESDPW